MAKKKKLNIALIEPGHTLYKVMRELLTLHHDELYSLHPKIALAWRFGWGPNADGQTVAGQCRKASDLDRELHQFDFVILLNFEFFNERTDADETDSQMIFRRTAVLDHELCHCAWQVDKEGEPKRDEKGRVCWRIRKHDIEEFHEIGIRYGGYRDAVAKFGEALELRKTPLLKAETDQVAAERASA